jgi:hypothetical protein
VACSATLLAWALRFCATVVAIEKAAEEQLRALGDRSRGEEARRRGHDESPADEKR